MDEHSSVRLTAAREQGFTLIELMVVVLIIGILIAIALPTFLGARERAANRAAQSGLRNALIAARTIFTDTGDFSTVTSVEMKQSVAELDYVDTAGVDSTDDKMIAWSVSGCAPSPVCEWHAAALAPSTGTCWYIKDVAAPTASVGIYYGQGAATACTGADADTGATAASW